MESRNPYVAPQAKVSDAEVEYGEIKIYSASGRIGRVRYIGYSIGLTLLFGAALGVAAAGIGAVAGPTAVAPVIVLGYVGIFLISILLTIQRAHDFNASGWMALLIIVPLVNLIFWFIPGTDGENRFGRQTPPNGVGAIVLALILPLVFVIGIVAAIALPQYQAYVKRAQQAEQESGQAQDAAQTTESGPAQDSGQTQDSAQTRESGPAQDSGQAQGTGQTQESGRESGKTQ